MKLSTFLGSVALILAPAAYADAGTPPARDYGELRDNAFLLSNQAEGLGAAALFNGFDHLHDLANAVRDNANTFLVVVKDEAADGTEPEERLDAAYNGMQAAITNLQAEWAAQNYGGFPLVDSDYGNVMARDQLITTLWN